MVEVSRSESLKGNAPCHQHGIGFAGAPASPEFCMHVYKKRARIHRSLIFRWLGIGADRAGLYFL